MLTLIYEAYTYKLGNAILVWPMVLAGAVGFWVIGKAFGYRKAAQALLAYALFLIFIFSNRKSRQEGWQDRRKKEVRDVEAFQKSFKRADDIASQPIDPDRLRDDDGYRRK